MSDPNVPIPVRHEPNQQRFVAALGGDVAVLQYRLQGQTLDLYHTEVPPAFRGRGIAEQLCRAAFEHAKANGWRVIPSCPYISSTYLQRHPEYAPLAQRP